ncbi:uncharacterized protein STEHIDRAFT_117406 [Stereum hirsutum FP-91666 SS1]|uniref:uncharacterized protein n=1 Tax=Stereum hirsutum (strain FP-91666) TaxID=721885 RepID=UPI000440E037|nr:uncharacterized protein STEHIDRAFT_117406 [Stereum hirsutum FP-91666 SS1]EIM92385.1 hypothetical protein STEHIDRAFT_117406 [Stereum hirsutum FP-91666 SS1]
MAPYYGPTNEDFRTIMLERYFLAGDLLVGVGYGIQVVLYVACAIYLWKHIRASKSYAAYQLAYITLLFVIQSIYVGVQAVTVQLMYVDNRNYPGGPWTYFEATQALAVNVMFEATIFVMTFLCDCLVFWRCWVIWSASNRTHAILATAFPALLIVGSFVMGTFWTLQSSQPGLTFYSKLPLAFGSAYYSISLGVNILLTILIILRLALYRRQIMSSMGAAHAKHYVSLATMVIESAVVYSAFALLFLITYAAQEVSAQIWLGVASSVQQITTYLIIYRLAEGRAWKQDTLQSTYSTMQFNHSRAPRNDVELAHRSSLSGANEEEGYRSPLSETKEHADPIP